MKDFLKQGYVQVYTGNGKGKTTASFGLALRALGAGCRVFIGQFTKGRDYSELQGFAPYQGQIDLHQFGEPAFIRGQPSERDIELARQGYATSLAALTSGDYDLVILDEANIAVYFQLFSIEDLLFLIDQKPKGVELVITGRYAHEKLIERADLVTEMKEIKHYYQAGVQARKGVEK